MWWRERRTGEGCLRQVFSDRVRVMLAIRSEPLVATVLPDVQEYSPRLRTPGMTGMWNFASRGSATSAISLAGRRRGHFADNWGEPQHDTPVGKWNLGGPTLDTLCLYPAQL